MATTISSSPTSSEQQPPLLPVVILHRFPQFNLSPFITLLTTKYKLLDQHSDTPDPSYSTHSISARILLCLGPNPLSSADLDRFPALECVVCTSAGINHVDLDACRRRRIRVTTAGDSFSDDVADYAVGLAIDVLRRVSAADRFVRAGSWPVQKEFALGSKVSGKRVGILGLGSIGTRIAMRFEGFGCKIAYNSRKMKSHVPYLYYDNIIDLASNSDILIVCCALTDETYHVINTDVMTAIGKNGIIVNVGRGQLIDEKELVLFLVRGDIGGAGLDVFENEPHVPEELFTLDNVVLSAHRAVLTPDSFAAFQNLALNNLEAFFSNKPLQAELQFD